MLKNTMKNSLNRATLHKYEGPNPRPSKSWHKIVLNIVTILVIAGICLWIGLSTPYMY